jgi:hypothetical protein
MTTEMRRPRRRSLLLALAVLLLILLCALLIIIVYPIISPPAAGLKADAGGPYTVDEAQPLSFDGSASSDGNITNYEWDFGDGSTGSGVSPTHMYQDGPAQYDVKLTVTKERRFSSTGLATIPVPLMRPP